MKCDQAHALLQAEAYADTVPPAVTAHLADCAECQAYAARLEQLNRLLDADEGTVPRPGFDTRFFARLAEQKAEGHPAPTAATGWLRWVLGLVPAAALAALLLWTPVPAGEPSMEQDLALAVDLELVEELEVVEALDEAEAYELLAWVDVGELDQLLEGVPQ